MKLRHLQLLVDTEKISTRFIHLLLSEEARTSISTSEQATNEGEQTLSLLSRLIYLSENNADNHQLIIKQAVSTSS